MSATQEFTKKNKQVQEKKYEVSLSNSGALAIAELQLAELQSKGLCAELPETMQELAKSLALALRLDLSVGTPRLFIIIDTREKEDEAKN